MLKRLVSLSLALALCGAYGGFAEEGKTIRMLVGTQSFDMNTNYVGCQLEEITGYKVQYDYYADDNQLHGDRIRHRL